MRMGIRTSVLSLMLAPTLVIALVLVIYLTHSRLSDLEQSTVTYGQSIANQLAGAARFGMTSDNRAQLDRLAHLTLLEDEVSRVTIADASGNILVEKGNPQPSSVPATAFNWIPLEQTSPLWFEAPILVRSMNLIGRAASDSATIESVSNPAKIIGLVRLQLSSQALTQRQREAIGTSLLLTFCALLLAILLGHYISRSISDPILRMENAVRKLRDAQLDTPAQKYSSGTLSSLEQHLNAMVTTLKTSHEHLQDQVDEATAELRETMEELEIKNVELDIARRKAVQASRVKSEFLANMSHEIRTPMNGVMGYIALLSKTELNRTQQGYLQTLRASAENLMDILNDTLDFSKIEAGKFTIRKRNFDLREVLENAVLLFAANAHYKGLNLILDIEPDVPSNLIGDAPRLAQIITNLVSNAIKSTDQGEVEIRVSKAQESARSITLNLEVHDTGIGIAPEAQKRLFNAFDQLDSSTTRRHGGTGLGLAITQRLVSLMNGQIRVESQPGVGTVFYVSLVVDKQENKKTVEENRLLNFPILLISEDITLTRAVSHILEFAGALPRPFTNLTAAADWLKGSSDDADALRGIILDHDDSDVIPQTFLEAIEEYGLGKHCVLILMGASKDRLSIRCFNRFFHTVYFANKPPTSRELLNFLNTRPQSPDHQASSTNHSCIPVKRLSVPDEQSSVKVLLADDNLINRQLARIFLNQLSIQVDEASNGLESVESCRHNRYDLILMDIHMPEMDGLEATQCIRALENNPNRNVPIVALTADAMNQERTQYLKAGMNDHLSKPITEAALKNMLEKWCFASRAVSVPGQQYVGMHYEGRRIS